MSKDQLRCGIVFDSIFTHHHAPSGHPERAARLEAINRALQAWDHFRSLEKIPVQVLQEEILTSVHTQGMVSRARATLGEAYGSLDPDTYTSPESFQVALTAAGSSVDLTKRVVERNLARGFALIRPPGHHAESNRSMGFCLFNNVALAAEYAIRNYDSIRRVAIVDFDVHHGNGTQEIFYHRADVLYLSSHQMPLYPGTGSWGEQGEAEGRGTTINFPLQSGMGDEILVPLYSDLVACHIREFRPDLLLVSAGYDAHARDPLASLQVSSPGFGEIVRCLRGVAHELDIPDVYFLEGGYDLIGLAESVRESFEALLSTGIRESESNAAYRRYKAMAEARRERRS